MERGYQLAQKGKIVRAGNVITDGLFPESKEAIGGYWFIIADSLEEAADIAKGNPCLKYGATVEGSCPQCELARISTRIRVLFRCRRKRPYEKD
jgi:hypothetical protein